MTPADLDELTGLLDRAIRAPATPRERGATDEEIAGLAAALGWTLPADLEEWLRLCRGEAIGAGGVFGVRPDAPSLDIVRCRALFPEWSRRRWSPIASDGCGNYFVVTEDGSVGFIDVIADPQR